MNNLLYGMNRMVAPTLDLPAFIELAARVGAGGVELRNDLPGFDVIDALDPGEVRDVLDRSELSVLSINAVQHFNLPSAVEGAKAELKRLIDYAKTLRTAHSGTPAIVMCPHCDTADSRRTGEMAKDTAEALRYYRPILEDAGVVGLVEPLGFPESSLRDTTIAAEILGEIGSDVYKLTLDTFHFSVAGLSPKLLGTTRIPVKLIGLIHLSGVVNSGTVAEFRDPDRVLVDAGDRVHNVEILRTLSNAGYSGAASFEPFSSQVHELSVAEVTKAIVDSIDYLNSKL